MMIQLSMLPIQVTTIIAGLLFSSQYTHHHHVHGVHVDGVYCGSAISVCPSPSSSAFQYCKPYCGSILSLSSRRSSLTKLRYSSDEDESGGSGVMSWLQQPTTQKQPLLLSDEVLHSSTDINDRDRWDCIDGDNYDNNNGDENNNNNKKVTTSSVIDDEWTNNSKERRNRRIQSLENFNNNNIDHNNNSQHDINRSGEGREPRDSSNTLLGLPYNDLSQLQAIQSNAPAILLPSGPG